MQLDEVQNDLKDPRRFGDALAILQTQEFQKKDIKRVFNAYSDNIYYLVSGNGEPINRASAGPCRGTESRARKRSCLPATNDTYISWHVCKASRAPSWGRRL